MVNYEAGATILYADDPSTVLARTSEPLLSAELAEERNGIVRTRGPSGFLTTPAEKQVAAKLAKSGLSPVPSDAGGGH